MAKTAKNDTFKAETESYSVHTDEGIITVEATSVEEAIAIATKKVKKEDK